MYCAVIALVFRVEVVCFSPGQRASMSMLTRIKEFVATLGLEDRILMSNSESIRVQSLAGGTGLVRSLPSAVAVRAALCPKCPNAQCAPYTSHTTPPGVLRYRKRRVR